MSYLGDGVVRHLRQVANEPDLTGTRYTLERELGRGGLGIVWAVRDGELGRTVALKVAGREEARTIAQLDHPGIVPIHDAGQLPDGRAFYVMKLIDGTRLDQHEAPLNDRLRVFLKICDAVAFAHSRGVIHRDLKPQNVMVGRFGEVYVMDWGLPGTGTPGFMSPEQQRGEPVDERSDIHAMGALLATLIGAERPLRAIARRAQAAEASQRYASVLELAADVARYLDHEGVMAYRENLWERAQRFAVRNSVLLLLLAAYVLVRFFLFFLQRW